VHCDTRLGAFLALIEMACVLRESFPLEGAYPYAASGMGLHGESTGPATCVRLFPL
jgi:hypothetical protein